MHDYLAEVQSTYDSLAGYGHRNEEIQHTSIILNGMKGLYDNFFYVIHLRHNPYDIASISSMLLDVEVRLHDQLFNPNMSLSVDTFQQSTAYKPVELLADPPESSQAQAQLLPPILPTRRTPLQPSPTSKYEYPLYTPLENTYD